MSDTRLAICHHSNSQIVFASEEGETRNAFLDRFGQAMEEATVGFIGIEQERHLVDNTLTGHIWVSFDTEPEASSERFWIEKVSPEEVADFQFSADVATRFLYKGVK